MTKTTNWVWTVWRTKSFCLTVESLVESVFLHLFRFFSSRWTRFWGVTSTVGGCAAIIRSHGFSAHDQKCFKKWPKKTAKTEKKTLKCWDLTAPRFLQFEFRLFSFFSCCSATRSHQLPWPWKQNLGLSSTNRQKWFHQALFCSNNFRIYRTNVNVLYQGTQCQRDITEMSVLLQHLANLQREALPALAKPGTKISTKHRPFERLGVSRCQTAHSRQWLKSRQFPL